CGCSGTGAGTCRAGWSGCPGSRSRPPMSAGFRWRAPVPSSHDLDGVAVGKDVVAADALVLELRRRAADPRPRARFGEGVVNQVRRVDDGRVRLERVWLGVVQAGPPQVDTDQPRELPDGLAEAVEARLVEDGNADRGEPELLRDLG